jgi:hypothetical protein
METESQEIDQLAAAQPLGNSNCTRLLLCESTIPRPRLTEEAA